MASHRRAVTTRPLLVAVLAVVALGVTVPVEAAGPLVAATPLSLPRRVASAPASDGKWAARMSIHGRSVVWVTNYHPFSTQPRVYAVGAVIEQTRLRAGLFNGPTIPGGAGWHNGTRVMSAAVPSLVAAFNGGFEFQHLDGGYFTEGRTMKQLVNGQATLAINRGGLLKLGVYGVDIKNDGSWRSIRQNLVPLVRYGVSTASNKPESYWGNDYGRVWVTSRSALCTRTDGRLMYVYMPAANVRTFASAMVAMGCRLGMELDINGPMPQFAVYKGFGTSYRTGVTIDGKMTNPARYLTQSKKDFFALFDPALLPLGTVA
jgi:hypothetical protein